jgi:FkbM family methyltransferase
MNWLYTLLEFVFFKGVRQEIGRDHVMRTLFRFRNQFHNYEPVLFEHVMSHIRAGDVIVEVGAYVGVFTIPMARRTGATGKVIAFEPDPTNVALLRKHAQLNAPIPGLDIRQRAVSERAGWVRFTRAGFASSHIVSDGNGTASRTQEVEAVTLDEALRGVQVDILKIDVEGFELNVLRGGKELLTRPQAPRRLYIEMHPQFWSRSGASSAGIVGLMDECGYRLFSLDSKPVHAIKDYGHLVGIKQPV